MFRRFQTGVFLAAMLCTLGNGCSTTQPGAGDRSESSTFWSRIKGLGGPSRAARPEPELPVKALAHFATGLSHDLNGETEQALEHYTESALANPSYEPLLIEVGRRLVRAGQSDKAIEVLAKAAQSPDASGNVYAWLALAHNQNGDAPQAIRANRKAIQMMPGALPAYQNLAQIYLQNGQTNEAFKVLDQAAAYASPDARFLVDLAELYVRFGRLRSSDAERANDRARAALDQAAQLKPKDFATQQKLADGFYQLAEWDRAEAIYLELLQQYPDMLLIRGKLLDIYARSENKEKLSEQLEAIAREDPTNPRTYSFLGALALEENKLEEAARHFEKAILLNPSLEPIYYDLAGLRIRSNQPKEAMEILDQARDRFKLKFVMEYYTAIAHVQAKDYKQALKYFTSAEVLAKASEPSRLNHIFYYQIGSAHERNGLYDRAAEYFEECLKLAPDYPDAMNYLGYMWTEQGINLERAHELIQKAVELEPDNAAFLDSMGWVLFKLNQPRQALDWILKAVEHSEEPDATIYDHLGDIHAQLQEPEQAMEAWRKALSVEPNEAIQRKLDSLAGPKPVSH